MEDDENILEILEAQKAAMLLTARSSAAFSASTLLSQNLRDSSPQFMTKDFDKLYNHILSRILED